MKKVRRFNGEEGSEVSDEDLNQLRQDQTDRMMRLARGESGDAPAASVSRSMAPAAESAAEPAPENTRVQPNFDRFSGPAAKPPIVTMDQVKKAGFSTLREYLNDQQGLKPRGTPSSSTPPPTAAPKVEDKKADTPVERGLPAKSAKEQSLAVAQIPLDDEREPVKGESASGSELGRNISNTLSALPISRGIQAAQSGAKLAGRKAVEEFVRKEPIYRNKELEILKDIPKLLGGPKKQAALPAPPSRLALPAPPRRLPYDRPAASAAESTTAKLAGELRRGAQPTKFTSPSKSTASKKTRKFNEDEGGVEFRRGGSVSSASKRADGCAIRGKTRA